MRLPALVLASCLSTSLHAADSNAMLGDAGCRVVNPHPAQQNRVEWSGPCKDGFAHGTGVLEWGYKRLHFSRISIARYEGEVERGMAHGTGRKSFWNGAVYEGEFRNGRFEGRGTMTDPDGRYEGEWKNGLRDGRGKMVFHIGGSYDGGWKENHYFGTGEVTFPGGRTLKSVVDQPPTGAVAREELDRPGYGLRFGPETPRDPVDASRNYGLDYGRHVEGEDARSEEVRGSNVPYNKSYQQLSPGQKLLVRDDYPLMDEADEPPYPEHGTQGLMEQVRHKQGARLATGVAVIYVTVNPDGTAKSALVARTPKQTLTDDIKAILLKEKYKPGLCAGRPCEMVYPFRMSFGVVR